MSCLGIDSKPIDSTVNSSPMESASRAAPGRIFAVVSISEASSSEKSYAPWSETVPLSQNILALIVIPIAQLSTSSSAPSPRSVSSQPSNCDTAAESQLAHCSPTSHGDRAGAPLRELRDVLGVTYSGVSKLVAAGRRFDQTRWGQECIAQIQARLQADRASPERK